MIKLAGSAYVSIETLSATAVFCRKSTAEHAFPAVGSALALRAMSHQFKFPPEATVVEDCSSYDES